jgi:hypothetical protein
MRGSGSEMPCGLAPSLHAAPASSPPVTALLAPPTPRRAGLLAARGLPCPAQRGFVGVEEDVVRDVERHRHQPHRLPQLRAEQAVWPSWALRWPALPAHPEKDRWARHSPEAVASSPRQAPLTGASTRSGTARGWDLRVVRLRFVLAAGRRCAPHAASPPSACAHFVALTAGGVRAMRASRLLRGHVLLMSCTNLVRCAAPLSACDLHPPPGPPPGGLCVLVPRGGLPVQLSI